VEPFHAALHRTLQRCGSEVERRLALAFLVSPGVFTFRPVEDGWIDDRGVELRVQVPIASFRADFTLSPALAIEVDGRTFHDASPEATDRDRRRDRQLLARGWRVLRFAEREVNENALAVAREAYALAGEVALEAFRRPKQIALGFK
jgi:very-short-patch-repair endonuclease